MSAFFVCGGAGRPQRAGTDAMDRSNCGAPDRPSGRRVRHPHGQPPAVLLRKWASVSLFSPVHGETGYRGVLVPEPQTGGSTGRARRRQPLDLRPPRQLPARPTPLLQRLPSSVLREHGHRPSSASSSRPGRPSRGCNTWPRATASARPSGSPACSATRSCGWRAWPGNRPSLTPTTNLWRFFPPGPARSNWTRKGEAK